MAEYYTKAPSCKTPDGKEWFAGGGGMTANDLISRSALYLELSKEASHCIELGTKAGVSWATALQEAKRILQNAPAVDAVEVVRCRDCKWYKKSKRYGHYQCGNPREGMASGVELMPYDYCSYGERRNGDG